MFIGKIPTFCVLYSYHRLVYVAGLCIDSAQVVKLVCSCSLYNICAIAVIICGIMMKLFGE